MKTQHMHQGIETPSCFIQHWLGDVYLGLEVIATQGMKIKHVWESIKSGCEYGIAEKCALLCDDGIEIA